MTSIKPIRILHVFGVLNRGGAETMIMNYYRNIDREKYQFDFVVHGEEIGVFEKEIKQLGGNIYRVPKYTVYNHFNYKKKWKLLLSKIDNVDIIHSHIRSTASIYLPLAKEKDYKTIIHSHNTSVDKGIKGFVKEKLQKNIHHDADLLFSCGLEAGKWLFGNNKFEIIPNSIPIEKFKFNKDKRIDIRNELGLNDEKAFVHVGRFHQQKNHSFLLNVFNEILKIDKNSLLYLVGDGELKPKIQEEIKTLGLESFVILLGVREDIPKLLNGMDVMIMPSIYEGLPVTLIEAQASGLEIFASDVITNEVNITKTINYISLDQDTKKWAEIILSSNENISRDEQSKMIEKSYYNVEIGVNKLIEEYLSLIKIEK